MIILYIPFSFEEAVFDLHFKAQVWAYDYKAKGKETIIVYHDSDDRIKQKATKALQVGRCQIYILSHGIDTPELVVSNQSKQNDEYKLISIQKIAKNFKEDLICSEFSNDNVVKLFFCDEYGNNKPRKMAEEFCAELDEAQQNLEIDYYSDVQIGLRRINGHPIYYKGAVRSITTGNELFYFNLKYLVGKSSSFRQGINKKPDLTLSTFFIPSLVKPIRYPEFSHPILKQFARGLVNLIQQDEILSSHQNSLIDEILALFPVDITDMLVDSTTILGKNLFMLLRVNKSLLEHYLQTNINEQFKASIEFEPAPELPALDYNL